MSAKIAGCKPDFEFKNWDHTVKGHPDNYCQPRTEAEVTSIVKSVHQRGGVIRAFGARHSWSPLVPTNDTLINLDYLNKLISVDSATNYVTVQAGIRIKDLIRVLRDQGLGLKNLGSITEQSLAGAISTGTHGTGIKLGNLSSQIMGVKMVTANGSRLTISESVNKELLPAVRVSLGALGIITEVTIACVPDYKLRYRAELRSFDGVLEDLDALVANNRHVRLYWFAGTELIYVMTMNRAAVVALTEDQTRDIELPSLVPDFGAARKADRIAAELEPVAIDITKSYDSALTIPVPLWHQESEYAVRVDRAAEAVRTIRKLIEQNHYVVNFPVEVRFVAQDDTMLSPAYGQDVCYVGGYTFGKKAAREFFKGYEPAMKALGGRPHWGKHITLSPQEAEQMYPQFGTFRRIRDQLDPTGVFANPFIRELFL